MLACMINYYCHSSHTCVPWRCPRDHREGYGVKDGLRRGGSGPLPDAVGSMSFIGLCWRFLLKNKFCVDYEVELGGPQRKPFSCPMEAWRRPFEDQWLEVYDSHPGKVVRASSLGLLKLEIHQRKAHRIFLCVKLKLSQYELIVFDCSTSWKSIFADVIKLKILRWEDGLGLSGQVLNAIINVFVKNGSKGFDTGETLSWPQRQGM